jgi:hypothetical protein
VTVLVATGKVDVWRGEGGDVMIGDTDLVQAVSDTFPGKPAAPVTVALIVGDTQEMLAGDDIYASRGYAGYSEWTPGSPVELILGEHDPVDLAELLIVIADE